MRLICRKKHKKTAFEMNGFQKKNVEEIVAILHSTTKVRIFSRKLKLEFEF